MKENVTKQGYQMNAKLRARVVELLVAREGESLVAIAKKVGVARRTLTDYMTGAVMAEVFRLKEELKAPTVEHVDRAMLAQACKGNVAAARLVYMRMAQSGQVGPLPTLDEMEAELMRLKLRELLRDKGLGDDENIGDAAAVADDKAG